MSVTKHHEVILPGPRPAPRRLLRFLLALLLLLPALLSGSTLHGPAALDAGIPFAAAVLAFPATRRRRVIGIALGVLSIAVLGIVGPANAEIARVLLVTLAIVGFFAWARWAGHEAG